MFEDLSKETTHRLHIHLQDVLYVNPSKVETEGIVSMAFNDGVYSTVLNIFVASQRPSYAKTY
jgi:hypothetical protein